MHEGPSDTEVYSRNHMQTREACSVAKKCHNPSRTEVSSNTADDAPWRSAKRICAHVCVAELEVGSALDAGGHRILQDCGRCRHWRE